MDFNDWFREFVQKAYQTGDRTRLRLGLLCDYAWKIQDVAPDQALGLLEQGHVLAQQLEEPWWVLYYVHRLAQVLIWRKRDYAAALALTVHWTVEARKPDYNQCPSKDAVQMDLISSYIGTDAIGYAAEIQKALDFMKNEVEDFNTRCGWQEACADFAFETGQEEKAIDAALAYLALADRGESEHSRDHYRSNALYRLCRVAHRLGMQEELLPWASTGAEIAARIDNAQHLIEITMWLALAQRQARDKDAPRTYRRALSIASRLGAVPWSGYYDAWVGYHEANGDFKQALQVRGEELQRLEGKGQFLTECRCRLHRCHLLKAMGEPLQSEIEGVRIAAQKLRQPQSVLVELEGLY